MNSPLVIPLKQADEPRDLVHRCVQALAEGRLVVLPTETVYGVAASVLIPEAVERLAEVKGRKAGHAFTLAIKSGEELWDYVPNLNPIGWRLAQRAWPGPLTLVFDLTHKESAVHRLASSVRELVCPQGTIGFRIPRHSFVLEVLRLLPAPLVLTSVNRSGEPPATTADEAIQRLPDVDIVFDDGFPQLGTVSTVVRVYDDGWEILRPGALSEEYIRRMAGAVILFVCTGNTCRSPIAEGLCRHFLAEKLGCSTNDLEKLGVTISSAGLEAYCGESASPHAVQIMDERGLDIRGHVSRPLTARFVLEADCVFAMTQAIRDAIIAQWPEAADRVFLLHPDGKDIRDPFGGTIETYRLSACMIEEAILRRRDQLLSLVNSGKKKD
ncbi:MAG: L-threonylcarbamoyladenylate synthase [Thermogutta sp.]